MTEQEIVMWLWEQGYRTQLEFGMWGASGSLWHRTDPNTYRPRWIAYGDTLLTVLVYLREWVQTP
jgi:hypothetical protein